MLTRFIKTIHPRPAAATAAAALALLAPGGLGSVPAADLLGGINHETAGDMEKAAGLYKSSADAGNTWAQFNYAVLLYTGKGVAQDTETAVKYWEEAAAGGHAQAKFNLALCHARGEGGLPQDYAKAVELWEQAAGAGISQAWANLALCAAKGLGMEADMDKAREFLAKAPHCPAGCPGRSDSQAPPAAPQTARDEEPAADNGGDADVPGTESDGGEEPAPDNGTETADSETTDTGSPAEGETENQTNEEPACGTASPETPA